MITSFFTTSGTCYRQHPRVEVLHPSGMRTRQVPVLHPTALWVRTYPNRSLPKRGSGIGNGRCRTRRSVQFGGSCGTSVKLAPPTGCTSTPWPRAFCTASCAELPSSWASNNAGLKPATTLLSQKPKLIVYSMKHI